MLALVESLDELNARAPARSASKKARFEKRGQLLPRERLARLLDPGMPFQNLFRAAPSSQASDMYRERAAPLLLMIAALRQGH